MKPQALCVDTALRCMMYSSSRLPSLDGNLIKAIILVFNVKDKSILKYIKELSLLGINFNSVNNSVLRAEKQFLLEISNELTNY